jgi:hypothetical protein
MPTIFFQNCNLLFRTVFHRVHRRSEKQNPYQPENTMRSLSAVVLVAAMAVIATGSAFAQGKPIQLALFNPVQIVPENESISGFRLSLIYGRNANVTGFDWGLVTNTTGNFTGVQWSFVGMVEKNFTGWQGNFVSLTSGSFEGLQMGMYSSANFVNGVQLGLVNNAGSMKGIQVGLLNFIKKGGFMSFFPIVNWGGL